MISFEDSGSGDPILWIHGFPHSSRIFEPQLAIAGWRHIRIDLPGFGRSIPPAGELTMADYSAAALDVLSHLGISSAVVAGISMGGYITMQIVRDAPGRVRGLILIDTRERDDSDQAREDRYKTIAEIESHGPKPVLESMLPKMVVSGKRRDPFREVMAEATSAGMIAAQRAMATRPDSTQTVRRIRVPALVVCGDRDPITPPPDARRLASLIPHAELTIIANAAHASNFDQPEAFNRAVTEFLGMRFGSN